jgi:hypothetical protein
MAQTIASARVMAKTSRSFASRPGRHGLAAGTLLSVMVLFSQGALADESGISF